MYNKSVLLTITTVLAYNSMAQVPFSYDFFLPPALDIVVKSSLVEYSSNGNYLVSGSFTDNDTILGIFSAELNASGNVLDSYAHSIDIPLNLGGISATPLRCSDGGILHMVVSKGLLLGQTACFIKVDVNGDVLWSRCLSDTIDVSLSTSGIMIEHDGDYIITAGIQFQYDNEVQNALLRISDQGDLETALYFDGAYMAPLSFELLPYSPEGFVRAQTIDLSEDGTPPYITLQKWTPEFELSWSKVYSFAAHQYFKDLNILSNGDLLVTGSFGSSGSSTNPFLCRLDSSGNIIWVKRVEDQQFFIESCLEMIDGSFICHGWKAVGMFQECLVTRFSSDGTLLKAKLLDDDYTHYKFNTSIGTPSGSEVIFTGTSEVGSGILIGADTSLMDLCNTLNLVSTDSLISGAITQINVLTVPIDLIFTDVSTHQRDWVFSTIDMCMTTTTPENNTTTTVTISPNPASLYLNIGLANVRSTGETTVTLINAQGQVVLSQRSDRPEIILNISELPCGVYLTSVAYGNEHSYSRVIIAR